MKRLLHALAVLWSLVSRSRPIPCESVDLPIRKIASESTPPQISESTLNNKSISHLDRRYCNVLAYMTLFMCLIAAIKAPAQTGAAANTDEIQTQAITGVVVDTLGQPIAGATVSILNTSAQTQTRDDGRFVLRRIVAEGTLRIRFVGYQIMELDFSTTNIDPLRIVLEPVENIIEEVEISTGYQTIPKERTTGSFVLVDSTLIHRSFSTDILGRLEGVVSGLHFDRGRTNPNVHNLSIRGISTLYANDQPLIILDNFEYDGNLRNINPNDVETVTILKDAAAASIWGARAGNGVIVITTKQGRRGQRATISATTNTAIRNKPDLYALPQLSSNDFVDLEIDLYNRGYYTTMLNNVTKPPVTPIVWLLNQYEHGVVGQEDLARIIAEYRMVDVRDDLNNYFYQRSISRQHAVSVAGGSVQNRYYASAGWDKNAGNSKGNGYERLTVNLNNTYSLPNDKIQLTTGVVYSASTDYQNEHMPNVNYPYAQLADSDGGALPVSRYNRGFLDTVGGGRLLDWEYRPLDELRLTDNTHKITDLKLNAAAQYKPFSWLNIQARYQYGQGNSVFKRHYGEETFFARDMINQFSTVSPSGSVIRPIPLGGIADISGSDYTAHHARGQIDVSESWNVHSFAAITGWEFSDVKTEGVSRRLYGFNEGRYTQSVVNFVTPFTSMVTGRANLVIPNGMGLRYHTDRFVSFYGNVSYAYRKTHTFSASARKDASNLFGVRANQKWVPLWSVGYKWDIDKQQSYDLTWLPSLKLRATHGKSGNIDKSVSAYLVVRNFTPNDYNQQTLFIANPPNPDLSWESVAMTNIALDFVVGSAGRISGSLEMYRKAGEDLIGDADIPRTSGLSVYRGNTASMKGHGIDLILNTRNLEGALSWQTDWLYSYSSNEVTAYRVTPSSVAAYMTGAYVVGRPAESMFAYKWAGLNPENGNPRGYLSGDMSEDYGAITRSTNIDNIRFMGSLVPKHFGGLRNTVEWKNISLSVNVIFKLGYYFRANSVNYTQLFSGGYHSSPDYAYRWRQPGDETATQVPSLVYPASPARDQFYQDSEILVERGDHIRLQDVRFSYRFRFKYPIDIYALTSNVAILWRANKRNLDPDYRSQPQKSLTTFGLKITI